MEIRPYTKKVSRKKKKDEIKVPVDWCPDCGSRSIDDVRGHLYDMLDLSNYPCDDDLPKLLNPERLFHMGWFCRLCKDYFGGVYLIDEADIPETTGH